MSEVEKNKPTLFLASDAPGLATGYSIVITNLVTRWLATNKYKIVCMGTNDRGEHHPLRQLSKDLIIEPLPFIEKDPYGIEMMPIFLNKYQPDLVFNLHDIWVLTGDERNPQMDNWFIKHLKGYKPYIPWISYFPVDGRFWDFKWVELTNHMTYAVVMSDYGEEVLSHMPGIDMSKVRKIYHGHDTQHMFPVSDELKKEQRKKMHIPEDVFVVGCFLKGTQVLMGDLSHKNIEDIKIGDIVINHKGEVDNVCDTMSRIYEGKIYEIDIAGLPDRLIATEEHPIYSVNHIVANKSYVLPNGQKVPCKMTVFDRLKFQPKQWTEIKNLNVGDYVAFPINKIQKDVLEIDCSNFNLANKSWAKKIPHKIQLTDDILRLIGYYLAQGSMSYHYTKDNTQVAHTTAFALCAERESNTIQDVIKTVNNKFSFDVNRRDEIRKVKTQVTLEINGVSFCNFMRHFVLGGQANNKKLAHWIMLLPPEKQLIIYNAWRTGDGHKDNTQNRYIGVTTSKELIYQLALILIRNGIAPNITIDDRSEDNPNHSVQYRLHEPFINNKSGTVIYVDSNYIYRKIKEVSSKFISDQVYNFSVQNEESYNVGMSSVHNCVNRQQPRKNIPSLIYAFKLFKDGYVICEDCGAYYNPDIMTNCEICWSKNYVKGRDGVKDAHLYLHMNILDMRGFRLPKVIRDNQLTNVVFPRDFNVVEGVSREELNIIFNMMDVHVNCCIAEGYGLTTSESLAAGTPSVATLSTSLVEQLGDNKGYLVKSAEHFIPMDALQAPHHLISLKGLVDTLHHIHDNPEEAKERAKKGREFALTRNWDDSAKQFEDLIDQALQERIVLHEEIKPDIRNDIFVLEKNDIGLALGLVPTFKKLAALQKSQNTQFSLVLHNRLKPILDNLKDINLFNLDRLWLDKPKLQALPMRMLPLDSDLTVKDRAATVIKIEDIKDSYFEFFAGKFNLNLDIQDIKESYTVTTKERNAAKELLKEHEDKLKICFLIDTGNPQYGIELQNWNKLFMFLKRFDTVSKIVFANKFDKEKLENIELELKDMESRDILAVVSCCDSIVTNIEEYVPFINLFNVPSIICQGPKDLSALTKFADVSSPKNGKSMIYFSSNKEKFQCMPCVKEQHERCRVNNLTRSQCMNDFNIGEVFSRLINIIEIWKYRKKTEEQLV